MTSAFLQLVIPVANNPMPTETGYKEESEEDEIKCDLLDKEGAHRYLEGSYKQSDVDLGYFVKKYDESYYCAPCIDCGKKFSKEKNDDGSDFIKPNNKTQKVRVCTHFETDYRCAIICNGCFEKGKEKYKEQIIAASSTTAKKNERNKRERKKNSKYDDDA